jgi:hypothetical protein
MTVQLIHDEAAVALQKFVEPASIDMAYSDPPFGTGEMWHGKAGSFDDRWSESEGSAEGWARLNLHSPAGAALLDIAAGSAANRAYIGAMAGIVLGVRRVLRPTGTLWLHFDDTMGAHLRLLCDVVFGPQLAIGTLTWKRTLGSHANSKSFGRVHDTIACYGRTEAARWRLWRLGTLAGDPLTTGFERFHAFADAAPLNTSSKERVGYPTQKPVALLSQLIEASTRRGDRVLDPTLGSGTTVVAAELAGRSAVGIDASADAIATARQRLQVIGQLPLDLGAAA